MLEVRGVHCCVLVCRIRIIEDGKQNVLPQKFQIKMVTKMPDKHLNIIYGKKSMLYYMTLNFSYHSENKTYGKIYYKHIGEEVNIASKISVLL